GGRGFRGWGGPGGGGVAAGLAGGGVALFSVGVVGFFGGVGSFGVGMMYVSRANYSNANSRSWGRHSCLPRTPADRNVCPTTKGQSLLAPDAAPAIVVLVAI